MATVARKPTAREKLRPSVLRVTQRELMGDDIDLTKLYLALGQATFNVAEAVTNASVKRTIEGASTLTVNITDQDRMLLRSGNLGRRLVTEIDGLYFILVAVNKSGSRLTLTFEDREVYLLRTYDKPIKQSKSTSRAKITRAQFVNRLIREVKEVRIPTYIPELEIVQPIQSSKDLAKGKDQKDTRAFGIPKHNGLTVKGAAMTENQRQVANVVLDTGASRLAQRKCLVMAIMCVIQESNMTNLNYGDKPGWVGAFQQNALFGWPASRDVARDAAAFYDKLIPYVAAHPQAQYTDAIQAVQRSATPNAYAKHRTEAERIVTDYGLPADTTSKANAQWTAASGSTGTSEYEFYRGRPPSSSVRSRKEGISTKAWGKENSWDCIQRLADEVQWRAFFVSGRFYFLAEDDLFKSKPIATVDEDTDGVISIDGDYDEGKKNGQLTIQCYMARWAAPPGSVVQIINMGPWNGRWLVNDVERSLFRDTGTITLKKPRPRLPEPSGGNVTGGTTQGWTGTYTAPDDDVKGHPAHSQAAARRLLAAYSDGHYRDDNGRQLAQLKKVASGQLLTNQCGKKVELHVEVLNALVMLLDKGYWVGTYALCEDHACNDGQHPQGYAVDISSLGKAGLGWYSLNTPNRVARQLTIECMNLLGDYGAWDLICNGVGELDPGVQACQIDNKARRTGVWESDHTNHIHFGAVPTPSGAKE